MLTRDFKPGFRIELHHKDMGIVTSAAREAGVVIPLGAVRRPADGLREGAAATAGWTTPRCCEASSACPAS